MNRFSYYKRTFLAPAASNISSYIIAEVESSDEGAYPLGTNMLTIADCAKQIELEFSLANSRSRRRSLARAELLAEIINGFRDNLRLEAEQIERASQERRRPTN